MQRASVRRLVNLSSLTVYGEDGLDWKEQDEIKLGSANPYIRAQQMNEQILSDVYHVDHYWQILNLRLGNVIGAHPQGLLGEWTPQLPNSALPTLLQVAAGQRDFFEIYHQDLNTSDGTSVRNYVHVMDVVEAVYDLMTWSNQQQNLFEHFNVTQSEPSSLKELIKKIEQVCLSKITIEPSQIPSPEIASLSASNEKLKSTINWLPKYSIEDMIKHQWDYYQNSLKK